MNLIYCVQSQYFADAVERELIHRYNKEYYLMNLFIYDGNYKRDNDHINYTLPRLKDKELNKSIINIALADIKQQILIYGQK
jgi:hypothetical protein